MTDKHKISQLKIYQKRNFLLVVFPLLAGLSLCAFLGIWLIRGSEYDYNPKFSPDNNHIVFNCYKPSLNELVDVFIRGFYRFSTSDIPYNSKSSEICMFSLINREEKRLTNNRYYDYNPAWSPDGKKIAFLSQRNGSTDIYLVEKDGNQQYQITDVGNISAFSWSPSSNILAYSKHNGGTYLLDTNSGKDRLVVEEEAINLEWSPNGLMIAFLSNNDHGCNLNIIDPNDGNEIIPPIESSCMIIEWAPDSKRIVFQSLEPKQNGGKLSILDFDSQKITFLASERDWISELIWKPKSENLYIIVNGEIIEIDVNRMHRNPVTDFGDNSVASFLGGKSLAVSPNGKFLNFVRIRENSHSAEIWLYTSNVQIIEILKP